MRYLNWFDKIGIHPYMTIKYNQSNVSISGLILTIIVFVITLLGSKNIIIDYFVVKNPNTFLLLDKDPNTVIFNNTDIVNDITISYVEFDSIKSKFIQLPYNAINITPIVSIANSDNGYAITSFEKLINCKEKSKDLLSNNMKHLFVQTNENSDELDEDKINRSLCFKDNTLSNVYQTENRESLTSLIFYTSSNYDLLSKNPFKQYFARLAYTQYIYQPNNINNPYFKKNEVYIFPLNPSYSTGYVTNIKKTELSLITNPFILQENVNTYDIYQVDKIYNLYNSNRLSDKFPILAIIFKQDPIKNQLKFKYTTLEQVTSYIGGFFPVIYYIFYVVNTYISSFELQAYLINRIFTFHYILDNEKNTNIRKKANYIINNLNNESCNNSILNIKDKSNNSVINNNLSNISIKNCDLELKNLNIVNNDFNNKYKSQNLNNNSKSKFCKYISILSNKNLNYKKCLKTLNNKGLTNDLSKQNMIETDVLKNNYLQHINEKLKTNKKSNANTLIKQDITTNFNLTNILNNDNNLKEITFNINRKRTLKNIDKVVNNDINYIKNYRLKWNITGYDIFKYKNFSCFYKGIERNKLAVYSTSINIINNLVEFPNIIKSNLEQKLLNKMLLNKASDYILPSLNIEFESSLEELQYYKNLVYDIPRSFNNKEDIQLLPIINDYEDLKSRLLKNLYKSYI